MKKNEKNLSRRRFLSTVSTAGAVFTVVPRHVMPGKGILQPSDTVNVAAIGMGSRGSSIIQEIRTPENPIPRIPSKMINVSYGAPGAGGPGGAGSGAPRSGAASGAATPGSGNTTGKEIKLANVYAVCDVDQDRLGGSSKGYPKAKTYTDWRELLQKEKSIDAVVIGTPDHSHATITSAFIKEKKHIYVEKPMAKTIYECRKLAELAKQYNVVTQMGNQGHATDGTRKSVEWIQSGVIGPVREVYCSTDRPVWPQGNLVRPAGVQVPKNLNYDVWLGPAREKPYHPDILHFNWRGLWDYGVGAMGDLGAHIFDAVIWALNLDTVKNYKIQAATSPFNDDYLPQSEWVTYEFPERYIKGTGYMPPVKVTWCDGGLVPPRPATLEPGRAIANTMYVGDKGIIMAASHGAIPQLVPADENFKGPDPWIPRTGNIFEDWIDAIKNGKKSSNDFSWAAKVTEIMLLTNIAVLTKRYNKTLEYDVENMKITNLAEANNLFHYEYRKGWNI
jgi:predicted dehydrogenase